MADLEPPAHDALDDKQLLAKLIESLPGLFYVLDARGHLVRWNRDVERVTGYAAEEIDALPPIAFFHPDDHIAALESMRAVVEAGKASAELPIRTKDGRKLPYLFTAVRAELGGEPYLVGVGVDRTLHRRSEDALRASEARFRTLAEHASVGIWQLSPSGDTVYVNPAMSRLLEVDGLEDLTGRAGRSFRDFLSGPSLERVLREHRRRFEGVASSYEVELVGARGGRRRALVSGAPLMGPDGQVLALMGTFVDVTERAEAEERRRLLEEELRHAQKMEVVGRLAGGMAHDFNNLLTPILGYAETALRHVIPGSSLARQLAAIRQSAQSAAALTRRLLSFSRKQPLELRVVDLNEAVGTFCALLPRLLGDGVEVATRLRRGSLLVEADPVALEQVLLNLAVNARDAMEGGGTLAIGTRTLEGTRAAEAVLAGGARAGRGSPGDAGAEAHAGASAGSAITSTSAALAPEELAAGRWAELSVSDTGHGMDAATRGHLFEPFFTTKAVGKGTGLGLSTVLGIVERHGGRLAVDSAPGRGSTFRIYLPVLAHAAATATLAEDADGAAARAHVLVVEDKELVRRLVEDILAGEGYAVRSATSAEDAEREAGQGPPMDLLITDVLLPGMSGAELFTRLLTRWPHLKVIYTSGYGEDALARYGTGVDAGPLLRKPFTVTDLLDRVAGCLGGLASAAQGPV